MNQQEQMVASNKENVVKVIKWGIILIIVILLIQECGTTWKTLLNANKPKADTIFVHKRDIIWAHDTTYKFKPTLVFKYKHDTIKEKLTSVDSLEIYRFFITADTLRDKNIEIYSSIHTQGKTLKRTDISYKLKVPLTIIDSVKETIKVPTLYPPTFQLQGGLIVGSQLFAPEIGFSYKRHTLDLGYNLTNKQPIVRYGFVIFRK